MTIHTRTIESLSSQTISVPAVDTLELEGRIDAPEVGALTPSMSVYVNHQLIRHAVTNRSMTPMLATGQQGALFNTETNQWSLIISPDFTAANTPAAGNYQVLSDPGQAYRYIWNIKAQKGGNWLMAVRIENTGQGAQRRPIVLKLYQH